MIDRIETYLSPRRFTSSYSCPLLLATENFITQIIAMEGLLKHHMFASHAIAAAGSVTLSTVLTHPLDTLKTLLQVATGPSQQLVTTQVLDRVRSGSGTLGLYSGLGWSTFGRISGLGARFGVYELLTAFYKDGREENYVHASEALLAGIAAGAVEAFASTPFEFFKLRAQVASASDFPNPSSVKAKVGTSALMSKLQRGYASDLKAWESTINLLSTLPNKHPNMVAALHEYPWMITGSGRPPFVHEVKGPLNIISLEGWRVLYRGLQSGIARDCIFGGVFFSTWQFLHMAMLDWKAIDMDPQPRSIEEIGPVSPLATSLAAGFSGSLAAAASHCFDTASSRSQCTVTPKYISMERRLLRWKPPGFWIERVTGISPADRNILFRGIWLRMARSGFASFMIVRGYFLAVDHLL